MAAYSAFQARCNPPGRGRGLFSNGFKTYQNNNGLPETFEINTPDAKLSYCQGIVNKINLDNLQREISPFNLLDKYLGGENYLLTISDSGLKMPDGIYEKNLLEWLLGVEGK